MSRHTLTRFFCALLALALLPLLPAPAGAGAGAEITADCRISMPGTRKARAAAFDGSTKTFWARRGAAPVDITVTLPAGVRQGGLSLLFLREPRTLAVWQDGVAIHQEEGPGFAHRYIPFPGGQELTIRLAGDEKGFELSELAVYAGAEPPEDVQRWRAPPERVDLLVLVAHPDDELLWMGGAIPYYALERGFQVAVAFMTCANAMRRSEMLNALWAAGLRTYPQIGAFRDRTMPTMKESLALWGGQEAVEGHVAALYRRLRPRVVLSHDLKGEYGHKAHIITARAAASALDAAAEPRAFPDSAAAFGAYEVPKLYLHLLADNPIRMDWQQPIQARGGMTAMEVCKEAYRAYWSQHDRFQIEEGGRYSPTRFGLYRSLVGPDLRGDDFFENIGFE